MYIFHFSRNFEKHFLRLTDREQKQLKKKLELLAENLNHPSLRVKRIQGTDDLFEFSVNMSIRVIWEYDGDRIILLLDVGKHDILKKY